MRTVVAIGLTAASCLEDVSTDCTRTNTCGASSSEGASPATGGNGGNGGTGAPGPTGGSGGGAACINDVDCTDADNARCNNGTCVPCTTSPTAKASLGSRYATPAPACSASSVTPGIATIASK